MKKTVLFLMAAMISVAMISCGGKKEEADKDKDAKKYESNSPEGVTEAYQKALADVDFKKAKEFVTKESEAGVDFIEAMITAFVPEGTDISTMKRKIELKDLKCEEKGDEATCTFSIDGSEEKVDLKKVDGEWKIFIDMGIFGGEMDLDSTEAETEM